MLDPQIHALLDVPIADFLVEDDADGGLGDVVDDAGFAVVDFVRHAFLHGAVVLDVHDVADFVGFHVGREGDHAFFAEGAGEAGVVLAFIPLRDWGGWER